MRRPVLIPGVQRSYAESWFSLSMISSVNENRSGVPRIPSGLHTPLDLLTTLLSHKLRYEPDERDMVMLSHEIVTVPIDGPPSAGREVHTSTLVTYGDPVLGSAMARTVGTPLAFAALRVLDGDIKLRGVQAPVAREIYQPILADLAGAGITMREASGGIGMAKSLTRGWRT